MLLEGVVGDSDESLLLCDLWVSIDAELRPSTGNDSKESGVVEVLGVDKRVEAVGAVRRPVAMGLDNEGAGRGLELDSKDFRGGVAPKKRKSEK